MSDPKGYYKILGLEKNCNNDEIKQSYRKLAMKWHPDRNPNNLEKAEAEFKKISEAHSILIDDNKRKLYDLGVLENQPNNYTDFNFDDLNVPGFFNMNNIFHKNKPKDIIMNIEVSFEDIYFGKTIEKEIEKKILCRSCNSTGYKKNAIFNTCSTCNGTGETVKLEQLLPGMMRQVKRRCFDCYGKGKKVEPKFLCGICNGQRCVFKKITKKIIIEKGLADNSQLIYENEGYICLETNKYGKLIININVLEHERFKRIGNHLLYENEIDLVDALCGYSFNVQKINNELITCFSKDILSPYNIQIVYNEGMPIYGKDTFGHLIIKSKIIFPKEIPEKRREFLKKTLLKDTHLQDEEKYKEMKCHILNEKQSQELIDRINNKNTYSYDYNRGEDEDDDPQVQCAQM